MNPALNNLQPYPFERQAALLAGVQPPADRPAVALSIGEPKHAAADFLVTAMSAPERVRAGLAAYPATRGSEQLRQAIAHWLQHRFGAAVDPNTQILPVNGTREALFSFGQAMLSGRAGSLALLPNPFYQIYEGAIVMRGTAPVYLPTTASNGYLPDFSAVRADVWRRCELLYVCSPGNPSGAVVTAEQWRELLELRDRYGFVIAADECYSEIYHDEHNAPPGLLEVCNQTGRHDFRGCVVFHSLSKRSNLPGLRSGFVAGDANLLRPYFQYRTYHGCAMPAHVQQVSALAWADEAHVTANRALYREKFELIVPLLQRVFDLDQPAAAFYLWPRVPAERFGRDDTRFTRELFAAENILVLPGSFLSRRDAAGNNPGTGHVRIALVAPRDACIAAAQRLVDWLT